MSFTLLIDESSIPALFPSAQRRTKSKFLKHVHNIAESDNDMQSTAARKAARRPVKLKKLGISLVCMGILALRVSFSVKQYVPPESPGEEEAKENTIASAEHETNISRYQTKASLHEAVLEPSEEHKHTTAGQLPSPVVDTPRNRRRFPTFGTKEFTNRCNWALPGSNRNSEPTCIVYYTPKLGENEGMSSWICIVTQAFTYAKLTGCKFLFDYGKGVNIQKVLVPNPPDWEVPTSFECTDANGCMEYSKIHQKWTKGTLPVVPSFRYAYDTRGWLYKGGYSELLRALDGYQIDNGMACAMGSLFHQLAPTASEFEPQLFTKILPALQDENSLVLAMYIRTGHADRLANDQEADKVTVEGNRSMIHAKKVIECTVSLEQQYLSSSNIDFSRIVWLVVSDSPRLKQAVSNEYNGRDVRLEITNATDRMSHIIRREVVTTGSKGTHTRPRRNPSESDFAEAMIDWYLVGESDAVTIDHTFYTFGSGAALRTARPVYQHIDGHCTKLDLLHEPEEAKTKAV